MTTSGGMKRVLMLCYYYPPLASAGTQRSVGFTRWLREYGWVPVVLTVKQSRIRWEPRCEDVPRDVEVVRTFADAPIAAVLYTDVARDGTGAGPNVPAALFEQLSPDGGRLVMPIGRHDDAQELLLIERRGVELRRRSLGAVRFVPLIGRAGWASHRETEQHG